MPSIETERIVDNRQTPTTQYKSLFKYFAIRLCVAVTLAAILLASVEFYSYRRYLPVAQDAMEPAVKLDLAEEGNPADREYWKDQKRE